MSSSLEVLVVRLLTRADAEAVESARAHAGAIADLLLDANAVARIAAQLPEGAPAERLRVVSQVLEQPPGYRPSPLENHLAAARKSDELEVLSGLERLLETLPGPSLTQRLEQADAPKPPDAVREKKLASHPSLPKDGPGRAWWRWLEWGISPYELLDGLDLVGALGVHRMRRERVPQVELLPRGRAVERRSGQIAWDEAVDELVKITGWPPAVAETIWGWALDHLPRATRLLSGLRVTGRERDGRITVQFVPTGRREEPIAARFELRPSVQSGENLSEDTILRIPASVEDWTITAREASPSEWGDAGERIGRLPAIGKWLDHVCEKGEFEPVPRRLIELDGFAGAVARLAPAGSHARGSITTHLAQVLHNERPPTPLKLAMLALLAAAIDADQAIVGIARHLGPALGSRPEVGRPVLAALAAFARPSGRATEALREQIGAALLVPFADRTFDPLLQWLVPALLRSPLIDAAAVLDRFVHRSFADATLLSNVTQAQHAAWARNLGLALEAINWQPLTAVLPGALRTEAGRTWWATLTTKSLGAVEIEEMTAPIRTRGGERVDFEIFPGSSVQACLGRAGAILRVVSGTPLQQALSGFVVDPAQPVATVPLTRSDDKVLSFTERGRQVQQQARQQ